MIKISKGTQSLNLQTFLFPGGEIGVKLDTSNLRYLAEAGTQYITARLQSANDIIELAMVKDALARLDNRPISLVLPYVPYGRQDRVCVPGEAFSLKVFGNLINAMGFAEVITFDPHSDVTGAVIDRLRVCSQVDIIGRFDALTKRIATSGGLFISPDAGANKKIATLAAYFGHSEFIRADKLRDLATGQIKETVVYASDLGGRDIIIVDDLCDGGRTFVELAKVLKTKNAGKIVLYVTHGLFTKGTGPLYTGGIDEIYTTNSYHAVWPAGIDDRVVTLDLDEVFSR